MIFSHAAIAVVEPADNPKNGKNWVLCQGFQTGLALAACKQKLGGNVHEEVDVKALWEKFLSRILCKESYRKENGSLNWQEKMWKLCGGISDRQFSAKAIEREDGSSNIGPRKAA